MANKTTLFNQVKELNDIIKPPRWIVGFKYIMLDDKDSIYLDFLFLMQYYGFNDEFELCDSYLTACPDSPGLPVSEGVDNFFDHLKEVGIFKKDAPVGGLEQTPECKAIYENILSQSSNPF